MSINAALTVPTTVLTSSWGLASSWAAVPKGTAGPDTPVGGTEAKGESAFLLAVVKSLQSFNCCSRICFCQPGPRSAPEVGGCSADTQRADAHMTGSAAGGDVGSICSQRRSPITPLLPLE